MPFDADVLAVQRAFPRIYHACHLRHVRRATTRSRLSARDAVVLAHLDRGAPIRAGALAKHLGLAASTLSAALEALEGLGYVARVRAGDDGRAVLVALTDQGAAAASEASVLDAKRLAVVLSRLTSAERRAAIHGLELLARASSSLDDAPRASSARRGLRS